MDHAAEEGTDSEHDGARAKAQAHLGHDAGYAIAVDDEIVDGLLKEAEIGLVFQRRARVALVHRAVYLGPGGADRGAFAGVQRTKMNAAGIRAASHVTTQGPGRRFL